MKNKFQKYAAWGLTLLLLAGCTPTTATSDSSTSQEVIEQEQDLYNFQQIYQSDKNYALTENESVEIAIGSDIGDKNYLKIELNTNVNLVGYIYYENSTNATQNNKEKIYIEKGATEFTTFLDAFRIGAKGAFKKKLAKISLQNVEQSEGNILVKSVKISDRTYDRTEQLYIDDGSLKLGTALSHGGAIRHIEKLNAGVVEYIDEEGNVRIEPNILDTSGLELISDEVNLVNIFDLGREIQQSYYAMVTEENGYAPTEEILYDAYLRYNPVQAGSAGDKESQIIDYKVTDKEIYVKVRPTEWFFDNILSDSYMENRYYFDLPGVVIAYNRFVNFSQFTGMETTAITPQEMPAAYVVQPLNYFYCETTFGKIKDPNLSPVPTSTEKIGLFDGVTSDYFYHLRSEDVVGSWAAFVNDKSFGLGMYMPGVEYYTASRGSKTICYNDVVNHWSETWLDTTEYIPSAHVTNYNYFSPGMHVKMLDFVPIEYEYAIFVGTIWDMKEAFELLQQQEKIDNSALRVWKMA